jgi:hypothetical protein
MPSQKGPTHRIKDGMNRRNYAISPRTAKIVAVLRLFPYQDLVEC